MKKRRFVLPIFLIIWLLICGVAVAYMVTRMESQKRLFVPAEVSCVVEEATDSPITQKSSIKVKNTGNIEAYIRVRLVSYWVQEIEGKTEIIAKESEMSDFTVGTGWVRGSEDTFYYVNPIEADGLTSNLLGSELLLEEEENEDGTICRQVVEVFAEAIQSKPEETVRTSWGVTVSDEKIVSVP